MLYILLLLTFITFLNMEVKSFKINIKQLTNIKNINLWPSNYLFNLNKNKYNKIMNEKQKSLVLYNNNCDKFLNLAYNPTLDGPNQNGQLTWYPIGFSSDFSKIPKKITIRDINYAVWKDSISYYALRDCCSHQGSSFIGGDTYKNSISCPYHGYTFNGEDGKLIEIPKLNHIDSCKQNVNCFKVVEQGDVIYLNTIPLKNETTKYLLDESSIFIEPEYFDSEQRAVYLSEDFEHYAKFVSVNSLDICHIGFVHTFGNRKSPNPINYSKITQINDTDYHYKISYEYVAGENSLVNKIYKFQNITVENEYVLPHTTVARVKFGPLSSTIITHALPISKFKTKLFVKAYRNYWSFNLNKNKNKNNMLVHPFQMLINFLGDKITHNTMYTTLKQDKSIVDNIDKTDYESMHGKFSILYDMFSNHYKSIYKKMYEPGEFMI